MTENFCQQPSSRRRMLLVPILCAHFAALAWAATAQGRETPSARSPSLIVVDVPAERPSPPSPQKAVPPKSAVLVPPPIIEIAQAISVIAVAPLPASTAEQDVLPAGGCDLTDVVQAALRADDIAKADLVALPSTARSVANAVMLWDGSWVGSDTQSSARLARVRAVVIETIRNATADCRLQLQAGPRLIAMPGPPDTMLAIGSGRWRWDDLTIEPPLQTADNNHAAPTRGVVLASVN